MHVEAMSVRDLDSKFNNFSSLRLLFASAVIFSHSPTVLTGNESLEPHFGRETLGVLAVDGFFLISGYLITKSFDHNQNIYDYFSKRILRLYPAFLVNMTLCLFVLAPLVTRNYHPSLQWAAHLLFLSSPRVDGVFAGMPMPGLNGPVWTLAYEFRCYILVVILGVIGFRHLRFVIVGAAIVLLTISGVDSIPELSGAFYVVIGSPPDIARLVGMFAAGISFYLWRESFRYKHSLAVIAACVLLLSTVVPTFTNLGIAVAGGYLIFWAAFRLPHLAISRFGDKTDLSYGIYLYAWPVQITVAYALHRHINPWALSGLTLMFAAAFACCSWTWVEKPALAIAKRRRPALWYFSRSKASAA
jgi:peptidoglycan/LPS O-acetylase OafA/YrhL